MVSIGPDQVEAEARALLKEAIERSGWYPILSPTERDKRIEQDVECYWHLMAQEAAQRLRDRFGGALASLITQWVWLSTSVLEQVSGLRAGE